tara:strand:+ start:3764 stop:5119 length:1356 start_codon:yes stop_codon:yes gene_type:complete
MKNKRELPHSIEAENSILGTIINDSTTIDKISSYLMGDDCFYSKKNQQLWNKVREAHSSGEKVDLVTICSKLTSQDKQIGLDAYYITGLEANYTSMVEEYAKKVYEKKLLRDLIFKSRNLVDMSYSNNVEVYSLLSEAHTSFGKFIDLKPGQKDDIDSLLDETIKSIETSGYNILKTGFSGIDELSGGMTRGEITILGGRPGHGKTTTMINLIKHCVDKGLKVIVFNREMTNVEMLKKLFILESGTLSYLDIRNGLIRGLEGANELSRVKNVVKEKYNEDNFLMFDKLNTFSESAAEVKKFKPDIIFDDYIQLITPDTKIDQRRLQLEKICNDYKWLVKSQDCVAVLLSQLNRGLESRGDARPRLSDLAESGAIEQVAENVFFVYYHYKVNLIDKDSSRNRIELIASKVRYGTSGKAILGFNGDKVKLYNSLEEERKENSNEARWKFNTQR